MNSETIYDTIIIGSGPSGFTAAVYTSRAAIKTLMLAGSKWGGQLMQTTDVENYPGFPKGIQGPELMMKMREQAERFGTEIIEKQATDIDVTKKPFTVTTEDGEYRARSIIVATGADAIWLGVPGEDKFKGKGVSSCAPCDAFFYKDKKVIVVGGGDSAMEEALVLTKFATHVTVVHRRDSFRASQIMQERVLKHEKITVLWNTEVTEILGDKTVSAVNLLTTDPESGQEESKEMAIDGVFVAIGHKPNSSLFADKIGLDTKGYVQRDPNLISQQGDTYTSSSTVEGIFVSGDIHDHTYRQAITAAGYGCQAALDTERWLDNQE